MSRFLSLATLSALALGFTTAVVPAGPSFTLDSAADLPKPRDRSRSRRSPTVSRNRSKMIAASKRANRRK